MAKAVAQTGPFAGYGKKDVPMGGYAALMGVYGTALTGYLAWRGSRDGREFPRLGLGDVLLFGLATHKITRIVARDFVTTPLRAPFVRFKSKDKAGEVNETSRGEGLRRAVGDLVSCTFCLGPWVGGALMAAHAVRPRETRLVASIFALTTLSDFLHRAYEWVGQGLKHTRERAKAVEQSQEAPEERQPAAAH